MKKGKGFAFSVQSSIIDFGTVTEPRKGDLLISSPNLADKNFKKSVILLCEHCAEGSFGLILNKILPTTLETALHEGLRWDAPLYRGGPVYPDTLHFLHKRADITIGSAEVLPGIFWNGDFSKAAQLMENKIITNSDFRFFSGYAGWDAKQLMSEMETRAWYVCRAEKKHIFEMDADTLWEDVLRLMGSKFKMLTNYPENPELN